MQNQNTTQAEILAQMILAHGDKGECLLWPFKIRGGGYGRVLRKGWRHVSLAPVEGIENHPLYGDLHMRLKSPRKLKEFQ